MDFVNVFFAIFKAGVNAVNKITLATFHTFENFVDEYFYRDQQKDLNKYL